MVYENSYYHPLLYPLPSRERKKQEAEIDGED